MNRRTLLQGIALSSAVLPRLMESKRAEAQTAAATRITAKGEFEVRALEIHSTQMWQWASVDRALKMAERLNLNTIIFHQRDMTNDLVLPIAFFTKRADIQHYAPTRKTTIYNNRNALRYAIRQAKQRGMRFLIEVNEIFYPHGLLEMHPELVIGGCVCPTHPFWWEFERKKWEEILERVPELDGAMISSGTTESKLSIVGNTCTCDRCRDYEPGEWYRNLTKSLFEPLRAKDKLLVMRDFSSTRSNQGVLVEACASVSDDIIISLKNTPQDFYPPFPNNALIGGASGRTQWVEFDVWGQFFGHGFFPCGQVDDIQQRMTYCKQRGAKGVSLRIDYECTTDTDIFNGFSMVNLFAGGMFANDLQTHQDDIYRAWMEYGLADPMKNTSAETAPIPIRPADQKRVQAFMNATWSAMEKTMYVRRLVFASYSCMFPDGVDSTQAASPAIDTWMPGASARVQPTDENIRLILEEKDAALREILGLREMLKIDELQMPASIKASLNTMFDLYHHYAIGFRHCAAAYFNARKAMRTKQADDVALARHAADDVVKYRQDTESLLHRTLLPHYVELFFSLDTLDSLVADVRARMDAIKPA